MLVRCPAGVSPRSAARDPDPLEAFRELIEKRSKRRTNRVALFPNRYDDEVLFDIGLACASLWK
jgi:hypothetical protein